MSDGESSRECFWKNNQIRFFKIINYSLQDRNSLSIIPFTGVSFVMAKPFKVVDSVMTSMTAAAATAKFGWGRGHRHAVLGLGDAEVGRQRRPRQQEVEYHSPPPAAGDSQRQGAEQATQRSDHHSGWCLAQNPSGAFTQQD